jgi:hypothetical protein
MANLLPACKQGERAYPKVDGLVALASAQLIW